LLSFGPGGAVIFALILLKFAKTVNIEILVPDFSWTHASATENGNEFSWGFIFRMIYFHWLFVGHYGFEFMRAQIETKRRKQKQK